jgi:ATP-dependent HslUV protease ATP-binding subunit HslU
MIRDLAEVAAGMIRKEQRKSVETKAAERLEERLLDLLLPGTSPWQPEDEDANAKSNHAREILKERLNAGELEERMVELSIEQKVVPVQVFSNMGMENMDADFQSMFEKMLPKNSQTRQVKICDARKIILEQETEALIDRQAVNEKAVELVENQGIIFLDEIDKVCTSGQSQGPDVSRQGVQRDLLPVVEGTTVNTRYGPVKTDHILFIAAGAFHVSKPSDLMPELQGRFPIRVELTDLCKEDFYRILTEPQNSLATQYSELLKTEGITLEFTKDGLEALADIAFEVNSTTQNIGARRLHTVMEKVVEEISFHGLDLEEKTQKIDSAYVKNRLKDVLQREDLARFIL